MYETELKRLRRDVRVLKAVLGLTLAFCACASVSPSAPITAAVAPSLATFEEITVQRINVRDENGTMRMVLANGDRAPGPVIDPAKGEEEGRVGGNGAGIVFYNQQGVENGALYHDGDQVGISIDRRNQDQTLILAYGEQDGRYESGMTVYERPDHPHHETMAKVEEIKALEDADARRKAMRELQDAGAFGTYRMFVGRDEHGAASVAMADRQQRTRLTMSVDASGEPRIEFLDAEGKPTYVLPPPADAKP